MNRNIKQRIRATSIHRCINQEELQPHPEAPVCFCVILAQPSTVWTLCLLPSVGLGDCTLAVRLGATRSALHTVYTFCGHSDYDKWLRCELDPHEASNFVEVCVFRAAAPFVWTRMHVYISTLSGQQHGPTKGGLAVVERAPPSLLGASNVFHLTEVATPDAVTGSHRGPA